MSFADRYVFARLAAAFVLAVALASGGVLLLLLLRFGPALVAANVPARTLVSLAALAWIPSVAAALGPATLLAGVVVLGRMQEDGEVLALRTLGVRTRRLAVVPVCVALAAGTLAAAITFTAEPLARKALRARLGHAMVDAVERSLAAPPLGRFVSPLPGLDLYATSGAFILAARAEGSTPVVAARRATVHTRGETLELRLSDADVRWSRDLRVRADRLTLELPLTEVVRAVRAAIPVEPTAGSLPRRLAPAALAASFALWMVPIGLGRVRGRARGLALAAGVIATGHAAFQMVETAGPSLAATVLVPGALAGLALLASRSVAW